MAYLPTGRAFHHVRLDALVRLVAHLVALETKFCVAVKRVVRALAAQNAVRTRPLIWALLRHVAELLAIAALYSGVGLDKVPRHLILQPREQVFSAFFLSRVSLHGGPSL